MRELTQAGRALGEQVYGKRTNLLTRLRYSDSFWAALLLFPNVAGFLAFTLFPMVASFLLSFFEWDILTPMKWVGVRNYVALWADPTFRKVMVNTMYYTAGTVPAAVVLAFLLAVLLNQGLRRVRIYRTLYFVPHVTSLVAVAIVWQWLYNPEFGVINYLLGLVGIDGPPWLSSVRWAMPAVILVSIWRSIGYNMVLYLAALQNIPDVFYEAAEIDGADWARKLWYITLPLVSPTTLFVVVMAVIGSFQAFDLIFVMTRGGPARSTSVIVQYLYENGFVYFKMGYASAQAYVLFALVLIVTLIQLKWSKRWVIYS